MVARRVSHSVGVDDAAPAVALDAERAGRHRDDPDADRRALSREVRAHGDPASDPVLSGDRPDVADLDAQSEAIGGGPGGITEGRDLDRHRPLGPGRPRAGLLDRATAFGEDDPNRCPGAAGRDDERPGRRADFVGFEREHVRAELEFAVAAPDRPAEAGHADEEPELRVPVLPGPVSTATSPASTVTVGGLPVPGRSTGAVVPTGTVIAPASGARTASGVRTCSPGTTANATRRSRPSIARATSS